MDVVDFVRFGTPTIEQVNSMADSDLLDIVFAKYQDVKFPQNGSRQVIGELQDIQTMVKTLVDNPQELNLFKAYDRGLFTNMIDWCARRGFETDGLKEKLEEVFKHVNSLVYKLKYHHQRIRPKQLAELLGVDDFISFTSVSADTPSFPSGHAIQSYMFASLVTKAKPELESAVWQFAQSVAKSRFSMGIHFKTDIDLCKAISEDIMHDSNFRKKFEDEEIFVSKHVIP